MDELTVQKTRCNCHPETCGHWPYSLMLGSERITTGEKADCERMQALLTAWNTRAASGGDSRSGEWVLVPRSISGAATDLLANFDMDSVGNNRGDAAEECWGFLIDLLGREPPELKFSNPVFHAGTNLTVRRGTKWHGEEWATVQVGDARLTVRLSCMTHRIAWLTDHWLRDEHDPACRTVAGLLAEMKRVYPGFSEHEEVTLVRFDVPAVNGVHAASGGDSASLEQRARELLARELDAIRFPAMAAEIRDESGYNTCGAAMVRVVTAALANQQGVEFPDVSDAEISAWLDRHDLSHAIRGADARAAFEDAQSFVLTTRPTQPAGDVGSQS